MESLGRQRTTRLGQIETERTRALGDLRENLARRRVLGSSFAQDALSRGEAEFTRQKDVALSEIGQQEALADYEATLKEIDTTRQLMSQEFDLARGSVGSILENMNLEASVAAGLATGATAALSKNAQIQSSLLQQQANNKQSFLTDVLGVGIAAISDRRLKRNIRKIGTYKNHNLYLFDYLWGERSFGVMADEVEKKEPNAVFAINGYKVVDYGAL